MAILSCIEREYLALRGSIETEVTIVLNLSVLVLPAIKGQPVVSLAVPSGEGRISFPRKNLRLSSLDNVFYSAAGFTKRDVIDYAVTLISFCHFDDLTLVEVR